MGDEAIALFGVVPLDLALVGAGAQRLRFRFRLWFRLRGLALLTGRRGRVGARLLASACGAQIGGRDLLASGGHAALLLHAEDELFLALLTGD
jgi:hypothetical protein